MDGPIQDMDVVRPMNKKFTLRGMYEEKEWIKQSTQNCPTYGNCRECFRSGPAGMTCGHCKSDRGGYLSVYVLRGVREKQFIDAEWLASKLNKTGHVNAMAGQKARWRTPPIIQIGTFGINLMSTKMEHEESMSQSDREWVQYDTYLEIEDELEHGWWNPTIVFNRSVLDE